VECTADALVREIVELGGREEISDMLLFQYNDMARPDVPKLEHVLRGIRDRLRRQIREGGREG
jgi:hypothetical protein